MRPYYLAPLILFVSAIQGAAVDTNAIDTLEDADGISPSIDLATNITAKPKLEKCVESNRCDYGHIYVDGFCQKGCVSKRDCYHRQYCDEKKKMCMFTYIFPPGRVCRSNRKSCTFSKSCCSGYCSPHGCARKLEIPKSTADKTMEEEGIKGAEQL
ncbi:hypothetical protein N7492_000403 [Penicillium capsulatum]|uniref:Uncharacterized protein n=1 Tax=Penicillium capsulatum TaxID=69766 RepID=A0A9W9IRT0_9EURO|nr:hypothetical protein N7492_000403 [Penicillium capsulatum]KAJ6130535.1 hypothetical protein N7512_003315 [Penicillium capsulatum]